MSHYEDGRSWLSLVVRQLGSANTSVVDALFRTDAPILNYIEHTKSVIAALDKARGVAQRAMIHFEMAKEDARDLD